MPTDVGQQRRDRGVLDGEREPAPGEPAERYHGAQRLDADPGARRPHRPARQPPRTAPPRVSSATASRQAVEGPSEQRQRDPGVDADHLQPRQQHEHERGAEDAAQPGNPSPRPPAGTRQQGQRRHRDRQQRPPVVGLERTARPRRRPRAAARCARPARDERRACAPAGSCPVRCVARSDPQPTDSGCAIRRPRVRRDKSPSPSDRSRPRWLRRTGPLSTGPRTLVRVHPVRSRADAPVNRGAPGFVVSDPVARPTWTPARCDDLLDGTRESLSVRGAGCQPRADLLVLREHRRSASGSPTPAVRTSILPLSACRDRDTPRPCASRETTGVGRSGTGGTTTTPRAVVATSGSASISAADAERSGRPRPTTTGDEVQGARPRPDRDHLRASPRARRRPAPGPGTARRSRTRTVPRRRRCGCTPRSRRRRTGPARRRRRRGCRRSARGCTARSGGG